MLATAVLVLSTLTCVGLAALWAAGARWHWFVRTMLFLGFIGLTLLIPAYELFIGFLVLGCTVALGVRLRRRLSGARERPQLSLGSALLAVIPLAILSAVAVRLPTLNVATWVGIVGVGLLGGVCILAAAWVATSQRLRWWTRSIIAGFLALLLAAPGVLWDQSLNSVWLQANWPPDPSGFAMLGMGGMPTTPAWLGIAPALLFVTTLFLWALSPVWRQGAHHNRLRKTTAVLAVVSLAVIAAPTAVVYWRLTHPLPIPQQQLPDPNGYDDLLAAVRLLPSRPVVGTPTFDDAYYGGTATPAEIRRAHQELAPAIAMVQSALTRPVLRPLDYHDSDLGMDHLAEFRTIARGMNLGGKLARLDGDFNLAANRYLELMQFGNAAARGGLMIDALVGVSVSGIGARGLWEMRENAPRESLPAFVERLRAAEEGLEPADVFIHRDRVWSQRANGWHGHLTQIISDIHPGGGIFWWVDTGFEGAFDRHAATLRLLQVELALRTYRNQHGDWPATLDQLTPEILPSIPVDPFSSDGAPLRYRRDGEAYVLYSVNVDGVDDGGAPFDLERNTTWRDPTTRDLRLDVLYAPEEEPTDEEAAADSEPEA